jgi:hypothetical protein
MAGPIALEYSAFAVDGRPDLGLVIYSPATPADADRVRSLVKRRASASRAMADADRPRTSRKPSSNGRMSSPRSQRA